MSIELPWMRPEAPYMPIATAGLLSALEDAGTPAFAVWRPANHGHTLWLETDRTTEQVAQAIVDAPWPDLDKIAWPMKLGQALGPMLGTTPDPFGTLRTLRHQVDRDGLVAEGRLLRTVVTDAISDTKGLPVRSKLLRGVKSDLAGIRSDVRIRAAELEAELVGGPVWRNGYSGRGLGFLPEVQTFGGTTGRDPSASSVGAHSSLLFRLLWLGVLVLPPVPVVHRGRRRVGGPLVTGLDGNDVTLSWPTWSFAAGLDELRSLFILPQIHADSPDYDELAARDIVDIHRSTSIPINSMIGAFRWGARVS